MIVNKTNEYIPRQALGAGTNNWKASAHSIKTVIMRVTVVCRTY